MPVTKSEKSAIINDLEEQISHSQALLLTDYRGLRVVELRGLRARLREMDCRFQVVKNRLLLLALKKGGVDMPEEILNGPVAVGFCFGDVVAPAKALLAYAEETKILSLRGGLLGQQIMGRKEVEALAKLPARDELLRRLLGQIQAPLYGLAGVLQAPLRNLAGVFMAHRRRLETLQKPETT